MGVLDQRKPRQSGVLKQSSSTYERIADALVFIILLLFAVVALAVVAVAAPIALAFSALAGLLTHNQDRNGWRPAGA